MLIDRFRSLSIALLRSRSFQIESAEIYLFYLLYAPWRPMGLYP
jgi:hypothetical protein